MLHSFHSHHLAIEIEKKKKRLSSPPPPRKGKKAATSKTALAECMTRSAEDAEK